MTEIDSLLPALREALQKREYSELTPVQKAVIAPEVTGLDVLVSAQTGSGKTVAFGLAMAPDLLQGEERFPHATAPLALVVAPTRELALQIKREFDWLYATTGARLASCVGGMDMRSERRALSKGAHIVVGTPGRLRDHIQRGSLDTSGLKAVVLDEADEMLDLGFREDLEFILSETPQERRTLLFSATVPRTIASLAKKYQRDAVRISTTEEKKQHVDIEYRALTVAPHETENAIINVLRFYEAKNALVFCATRATVNHITARFRNRGFSVVALSGELSQNERSHALQAMRDGRARVCIATDVAARGIDLPNLELVIHADLPQNGETLLHRSGRTGRAGRKGVSALIIPRTKRRSAERLLRSARIDATWASPPSADEIIGRDNERLMSHPSLTEPIQEHETDFIKDLLERHGPDAVAAAFVRAMRDGQSAPEELQEVNLAPPKPSPKRRDDFAESTWISLSIGRSQNAEPGWLLPVICKAGKLDKQDIGAIRIRGDETFVQVNADAISRLMSAIGPANTLQKNIKVSVLDTPPDLGGEGFKKPFGKKPAFGKSRPDDRKTGGARPKAKFGDKKFGDKKKDKFKPKSSKPDTADGKPKFKKPKKAATGPAD